MKSQTFTAIENVAKLGFRAISFEICESECVESNITINDM